MDDKERYYEYIRRKGFGSECFTGKGKGTISNLDETVFWIQDVATPADLWKISGYFFDDAKVVAETITDMVGDAEKLLNEVEA